MYVTVVCEPTGRPAVYGPQPTDTRPDGLPDAALACVVPLCQPADIDRFSGRIRHPGNVIQVDRALARAVATARRLDTVDAPAVVLLTHPGIRLLAAVGVFTGGEEIDRWWHFRENRLSAAGVACLPVALTATPADAAEGGSR